MELSENMKKKLEKASEDEMTLFQDAYKVLDSSELGLYSTEWPDVRAKHPSTDEVFVSLQYGPQKGVRIEIRVDSCPIDFLSTTSDCKNFDVKLHHYDKGKQALWAVYQVDSIVDLDNILTVIMRVNNHKPKW